MPPPADRTPPGAGKFRPTAPHSRRPPPADARRRAPRRNPASTLRILAFGAWLMVFALLLALLKDLQGWRARPGHAAVPTLPSVPTAAAAPAPRPAPDPQPAAPPPRPAPVHPSPVAEATIGAAPPPASPSASAANAKEPPAPRVVELILSPSTNGAYYARGEINGRAVTYVVDTGASAVAIPDRLRWSLNLTRGNYLQGSTANGIASMYETHIDAMSIGPIRLNHVQAVLYPHAYDDTVLLGMTALREVKMIQQQGHMLLQQSQAPEAEVAAPPAPPPPLKRSISECMGPDRVIDARVLKCMQEDKPAEPAAE